MVDIVDWSRFAIVGARAGNEQSYLGSARARLEKSSARVQLVS